MRLETDFRQYFAHGQASAAFNHLSVVARKAITIQVQLRQQLHDPSSRWIVIIANLALNLCANFYLIEPRIATTFDDSWDSLEDFFVHCVHPLIEIYQVGTVEETLRTRAQLHINRLTYLPTASNARDAYQLVDRLEAYIRSPEPVTLQHQLSSVTMRLGWLAEISAMRLHVATLAEPGVCSNDERLRALADKWQEHNMDFLQSLEGGMPLVESLLPFTSLNMMSHLAVGLYYVPLLCTLHDLDWFEGVAQVYNSLDVILDPDLRERIDKLIMMIRDRKVTTPCTLKADGYCRARHDGLDVLRDPRRLLC